MAVSEYKIRDLWYKWQIQTYVSTSLCLQIILIILGSQRKYKAKPWIRILLWTAYVGEISAATAALGFLGNKLFHHSEETNHDDHHYTVKALWPPFLLFHLGGPVTITAYSTEDNEFWLRSFLGFILHVGGAMNCFRLTWQNNTVIASIAIPIYIAGIIKYGERTFVLWSSSRERSKEILLSNADPYPDLVKINKQVVEERLAGDRDVEKDMMVEESYQLFQAFFLFKRCANLFAGFTLHGDEASKSNKIFEKRSAKYAFDLVAIELAIMYDVLYTKAILVYSKIGILLRLITFSSSLSASIFTAHYIDFGSVYPRRDIVMTYILLVVTVAIEVYEVGLAFCSDWAKIIRSTKFKSAKPAHAKKGKRWSGAMGQFNLVSSCLKDASGSCVRKLYSIKKSLKYYLYMTWEDVSVDLENFIFKELSDKIDRNKLHDHFGNSSLCKKVLAQRGDSVLKERNILSEFQWCTTEVDFDQSLLLWHIATDLCYYADFDEHGSAGNLHPESKISKCLSDYMLYLLVICPYMMPNVVDELIFTNTYEKAKNFFESPSDSKSISEIDARRKLLENDINRPSEEAPMLVQGRKLAKQLQDLESKHH